MHFGEDWKIVQNKIQDALAPLSKDVFNGIDSGMKAFVKDTEEGFAGLATEWQSIFGGPGATLPGTPTPGGGKTYTFGGECDWPKNTSTSVRAEWPRPMRVVCLRHRPKRGGVTHEFVAQVGSFWRRCSNHIYG
jgi:hypothetical protein